uniref:hypothetical protein n=1 Tax=Mucilaginibacter sp. Bleaf8 TaxID=2834430 RepID=UPI001BCDB934|nr:hypothetical protein [Mucilaginibacter sp. Bleaf8]
MKRLKFLMIALVTALSFYAAESKASTISTTHNSRIIMKNGPGPRYYHRRVYRRPGYHRPHYYNRPHYYSKPRYYRKPYYRPYYRRPAHSRYYRY